MEIIGKPQYLKFVRDYWYIIFVIVPLLSVLTIHFWSVNTFMFFFIGSSVVALVAGSFYRLIKTTATITFATNGFSVKRHFSTTTEYAYSDITAVEFVLNDMSTTSQNIFREVSEEVIFTFIQANNERIAFNFFKNRIELRQLVKAIQNSVSTQERFNLSQFTFDGSEPFISLKDELNLDEGVSFLDKNRKYFNIEILLMFVMTLLVWLTIPRYSSGTLDVFSAIILTNVPIGILFLLRVNYEFHRFTLTRTHLIVENIVFESKNFKISFDDIQKIEITYIRINRVINGRSIIITAVNQEVRSIIAGLLKESTFLDFMELLIKSGVNVEDKMLWREIDLTKVKQLKRW